MADALSPSPRWRTVSDALADGWMVASHFAHRADGQIRFFWLFIHPAGLWAEGRGATDDDALAEACAMAWARMQQRSEEIEERRNLRAAVHSLQRQIGGAT